MRPERFARAVSWGGVAIAAGGVAGVLAALFVLVFPPSGDWAYVLLPVAAPVLMLLGLPALRAAVSVRDGARGGFLCLTVGLGLAAAGRTVFAAFVYATEPALGASIAAAAIAWFGGALGGAGLLWVGAALARARELVAARWLLPAMGLVQVLVLPASPYADPLRLAVNVGWVVVGVVTTLGAWRRAGTAAAPPSDAPGQSS